MMDEQDKDKGQDSCPAEDQANLAEVRALARRGRYNEALNLLVEAYSRGECTEAEALDLKARICAQQGLFLQAEACWRKAQQLDAENIAYADALAALRRGQRPMAVWVRAWGWATVLVLVLALVWGMVASHRQTCRERLAVARRFAALEGSIQDRANNASAQVMALLATTADVDAATRQTSAGLQQAVDALRKEMDQTRQDWNARQDKLFDSIRTAVAESEGRISGENDGRHAALLNHLSESESRMTERLSQASSRLLASMAETESRLKTGQEVSDASLAKVQEAVKVIEAELARRKPPQVVGWEWFP